MKKIQIEILELKNLMNEMKNAATADLIKQKKKPVRKKTGILLLCNPRKAKKKNE